MSPRSSFFTNRLRAALWIAAAVLAVGLIVAVLVGFRPREKAEQPTPRRVVVAQYITRVDQIQVRMAPQVRRVDQGYRAFAKHPATLSSRVPAYRRAERTLATLRDRLDAVTPPPEARKLHRLLVHLADENVAAAHAVTGLASYLPRLAEARAPLRDAILSLRTGVANAKTGKEQAAVFSSYADATAGVAATIAALAPPSFLAKARNVEVAQFREVSSLARQVAAELEAKHAEQARALVGRLSDRSSGTGLAKAQRAGVLAYNARVAAIAATAKLLEKERKRVERRVRN